MIKKKFLTAYTNLGALLNNAELITKIQTASDWIIKSILSKNKLLLCGNGGSAADAQHIAGEFLCRFYHNRAPLPAIALTTDCSVLTSIANDYKFEDIFSRQIEALGQSGDVLLGISTSGSSKNVLKAFEVANKKTIKTILLTGSENKEIAKLSDLIINVPSTDTPRIQEMHLLIEHIICELVEDSFKKS